MPWPLKAALAALVISGAGALLIAFACMESGWESLEHFAWGVLTAGAGLIGGIFFSIVAAVTQPTWRRASLGLGSVLILLLALLLLFAQMA